VFFGGWRRCSSCEVSPSFSPRFPGIQVTTRWASSLSARVTTAIVDSTKASSSNQGGSSTTYASLLAGCLSVAAAAGSLGTVAFCERRNLCIKDPMTEYFSILADDDPEQYELPPALVARRDSAILAEQQKLNSPAQPETKTVIMAPSPSAEQYANASETKESSVGNNAAQVYTHASTVGQDLTAEEKRLEDAAQTARKHAGGLKLFSGNGNVALSMEIAKILGINLGKATVGRFADGEVNVMIHENVRGKDVYIIQPTCPPVNENLMELLLMVSTLNRASARRITVVIPYYGYARQDRKMQVRFMLNFFQKGGLFPLQRS